MSILLTRMSMRPFNRLPDAMDIVRHFPASFFSITMGTGILALIFGQVPTSLPQIASVGDVLWRVNVAVFVAFSIIFCARGVCYPRSIGLLLRHPLQSMFLGTIPMGLATIVNGMIAFRHGSPQLVYVFWWADTLLAVLCGIVIPCCMFVAQEHALERMTAAWLLPIVPAEVAAASGGLLAPHVTPELAHTIIGVSIILWALSVPLALGILALLLMRMAIHSLPSKELAISNWLALGPLGTGALGMTLLGAAVQKVFASTMPLMAQAAPAIGLFVALILWGYGLWWMAVATFTTIYHARTAIPFNMGWWGLTFPIGVYTAATFALGRTLQSGFFTAFGTGLTVLLSTLWAVVALRTLHGIWHGYLFHDPSLVGSESK